jgi:hypothetical protein
MEVKLHSDLLCRNGKEKRGQCTIYAVIDSILSIDLVPGFRKVAITKRLLHRHQDVLTIFTIITTTITTLTPFEQACALTPKPQASQSAS